MKKRNPNNIEESWLAPVSPEIFYKFLKENADLVKSMQKEISLNKREEYGYYYSLMGIYRVKGEEDWETISLGEFGPIRFTREGVKNDFHLLLHLNEIWEARATLYLNWLRLVAKVNKGRKINGKSYLQSLQDEINNFIASVRDSVISKANDEANLAFSTSSRLCHHLINSSEIDQEDGTELPF
ncbi:MAG: hypothetical protein IJY90_00910 [Clostridia bacterium]|nr:hypothetical protein [Clostridia bacterium]